MIVIKSEIDEIESGQIKPAEMGRALQKYAFWMVRQYEKEEAKQKVIDLFTSFRQGPNRDVIEKQFDRFWSRYQR